MVMYNELQVGLITISPAPLGAPSGGSKIRNLWHLKRRGTQFGFGWSNSRAEISVLEWFREEKVVSLISQIWLATFFTDNIST